MKKVICKIISILLVSVFCLNAFACAKQPDTGSDVDPKPEITENYLVKDNGSDYKVVLSQSPTVFEKHAAEELVTYLYEATGVKLKIVDDSEISVNDKLISVGYNDIQNGIVSVDKKVVGDDGFIIKTVNDDLFLLGGGSYGTLYSVYEVLEYLINFKVYAVDEIFYSKTAQVSLYDFDLTEIPSFETRHISTASFSSIGDVYDAAKMRVVCYDGNSGASAMIMSDEGDISHFWGAWAHTIGTKLLPWEKYFDEHPDWFEGVSHNKQYQVMLSNPEVVEEVAKNLKAIMDAETVSKYFMVGINDCSITHPGDEEVAKANGGYGGLYMLFLNAVEEKIANWYREEGVEKDYYIVGLAYAKFVDAPVDDNLRPVNKNVIANEKVSIMYAPIQTDWSAPLTDKNNATNQKYEKALRGWASVCDKMMVWSYSICFGEYLLDFDNYGTFRDNYQFYNDIGVMYVFDQSAGQTYIPFNALRDYVQSSLMWDTTANTWDLIEDFISNYYKVAAPYIREFFYSIRRNYQMFMDQGIIDRMYCGNSPSNQVMFKAGWTLGFCQDSMEYINKAFEAVEKSNLSSSEKEKLVKRIKLDSIMPRYLLLEKFADNMTKSEYKALLDEFISDVALLGVTNHHETYGGRSIDNFIESCKGKL